MTTQPIKTLFANDIHRRIEEVIKVDQTDEEVIRDSLTWLAKSRAIAVTAYASGTRTASGRRPRPGMIALSRDVERALGDVGVELPA